MFSIAPGTTTQVTTTAGYSADTEEDTESVTVCLNNSRHNFSHLFLQPITHSWIILHRLIDLIDYRNVPLIEIIHEWWYSFLNIWLESFYVKKGIVVCVYEWVTSKSNYTVYTFVTESHGLVLGLVVCVCRWLILIVSLLLYGLLLEPLFHFFFQ